MKKMVCVDSSTKKRGLEWLAWAPSHVEVGLLSEVLRYANIIDGIDESKKRALRPHLEIVKGEEDPYKLWTVAFLLPENKKELVYFSEEEEPYHCAELCPEYIEYLKNILKPYLK